jgi:hypothetical protein
VVFKVTFVKCGIVTMRALAVLDILMHTLDVLFQLVQKRRGKAAERTLVVLSFLVN